MNKDKGLKKLFKNSVKTSLNVFLIYLALHVPRFLFRCLILEVRS